MYVVAPFLANKSIIFTIERANELFVRLLTRVEFASMMAQENVRNGNIVCTTQVFSSRYKLVASKLKIPAAA